VVVVVWWTDDTFPQEGRVVTYAAPCRRSVAPGFSQKIAPAPPCSESLADRTRVPIMARAVSEEGSAYGAPAVVAVAATTYRSRSSAAHSTVDDVRRGPLRAVCRLPACLIFTRWR